jgi:hypothetical protein
MRSPCDPPDFDERDWSQFDFSRWQAAGVTPDAPAAALAELAERFFASPEWRDHFQAALPELRGRLVDFHTEHMRQVEEDKAASAADFDRRIEDARQRSDEFGKVMEAAASPPLVEAVPDAYLLAVKTVTRERTGLPGVIVRMKEPDRREAVLAEAVTDIDGNAVLAVPREKAAERDKTDAALDLLDLSGASLVKRPETVCIRIGETETKVVTVRETAGLEPQKAAALAHRSQLEARARSLAAKVDSLRQEKERRLRDLDCRLQRTREIVDALKEAEAPPPPRPEPEEPELPALPPQRPPASPRRGATKKPPGRR